MEQTCKHLIKLAEKTKDHILLSTKKGKETSTWHIGEGPDSELCESVPIYRRGALDQYSKDGIVWQQKGFLHNKQF